MGLRQWFRELTPADWFMRIMVGIAIITAFYFQLCKMGLIK